MVSTRAPPIYIEVRINGKSVPMIVDTGAAVSIVPEDVYKGLPTTNMENSEVVLTTYTGERIKVLRKCRVVVCYENQEEELTVYVVKGSDACLFGRDWLQKIRLNWSVIGNIELAQGKVGQCCSNFQKCLMTNQG